MIRRAASAAMGRAMTGLACLLLPGCSVWEQAADVAARRQSARAEMDRRQDGFAAAIRDDAARRAAQDVDRPWLAGRAQPLAREVTLPPALRENVDTTLMYADGRGDLPSLAARITRATGIPVRVRPDALLPADAFLPRLAVSAAPMASPGADEPFEGGAQPLARLLDAVAARKGIHWAYRDGAIELYRTETRVFDVRSLTQSASAKAKLGRSASAEAGGFENTSSTALEAGEQDTLAAVLAQVTTLLTRAGMAAAQQGASASIVVTDTPEALARVAAYVERENRILTRRVRLMFEEITLVHHDAGALGLDWSLLYDSARAAVTAAVSGAAATGAATLAGGVAGGPFDGSRALVSALSEIGTVVRHTSVPVLTLNRRPVTHAVRTTFTYIDQVQSTAVGTVNGGGTQGALPSVSISQKEETVGVFLTLVPDVQEDGQILLSVAYDSTVAQPLKTVSFGSGGNQVQIQQITVDGNGTVQQIELRPGQPMVISGFDRSRQEHDRRRLDRDAPMLFGGAERSLQERTSTLVVLSAHAEEGY